MCGYRERGLVLTMKRDAIVFAFNLDRLMALCSKRNATLARELSIPGRTISRTMVGNWRRGTSVPEEKWYVPIAAALQCGLADLFTPISAKTAPDMMMPLTQWARREGIPVGRAKNLFDRGILDGGLSGDIYLVPFSAHAPRDSKRLLRSTQRPAWVTWFAINLWSRMEAMAITSAMVAEYFNIRQDSVQYWRKGRSYPKLDRLPEIAEFLNCQVEDLIRRPSAEAIAKWDHAFAPDPEMSIKVREAIVLGSIRDQLFAQEAA
jgi:transcriptional regulator with XRE-family HTH domain